MSIRLYEQALLQLLSVEKSSLTAVEFEQCSHKSLRQFIKAGEGGSDAYNAKLEAEIRRYKRARTKAHQICTRSYAQFPAGFSFDIELWGTKATISSERPHYLSPDQPKLKREEVALSVPEAGSYLSLSVRSRSISGALDQATNDIALLLGILNFGLNHGTLTWSWFGSNRDVRAKVFPGRDVFVIDQSGQANVESWRYYTVVPKDTKWLSQKELSRFDHVKRLVSILETRSSGDRGFYQEFFRMYFDALSESDEDMIVIRLWKAAEHLTGSQSAEEMADRLALTWSDKDVVSAVCFALGHRRNNMIHNSRSLVEVGELA
ncbi:MAG: hypothetical protein K2X61_03785 [Caulobacteraceae bacterium]|nr:hypothetical protein [Caulobacteraceae bacterium]